MFQMEDGELNGIAFLDTNIFVVEISSVGGMILISDILKSVWFCVFQPDPPKMVALSKDFQPLACIAQEFIVDRDELAIVATDSRGISLFKYDPSLLQSQAGQRLIRQGEFGGGRPIQSLLKLKCRPQESDQIDTRQDEEQLGTYGVVGGTLGGGLMILTPISERVYRRLYSLYSRLVTHVMHVGGLNPRGYRSLGGNFSTSGMGGLPGPKGVIDGDLVAIWQGLGLDKQLEFCEAIGSKRERILKDLAELDGSFDYF